MFAVLGGEGGGYRIPDAGGEDREWPCLGRGTLRARGGVGTPRLSSPGAQGGSSTADSGDSAPRAAAAPTPGSPSRGAGAAREPQDRCSPFLSPHSVPSPRPLGCPQGAAAKPPRLGPGLACLGCGGGAAWWGSGCGTAEGEEGAAARSAPGEVQDGRNTPRARPAPSFTPWHRRRGGGEGRVLREPGTILQRTGMGGMDRSEFPQGGEAAASFPPALQLPFSPLQ